MTSIPDRLWIEESDRELYVKIEEETDLFEKKTRKEQFIFAMSYGFYNKTRIPLNKRNDLFLAKDLKHEDEGLINAIAVSEMGCLEIISDKNTTYSIAEEYAHAGIRLLYEKIDSTEFGTFWKHLEKDLAESFKSIDFNG
jgi:hypothetical protein